MSMLTTAASGYVTEASNLTKLLPENLRENFTQAIADKDLELVEKILGENAPEKFPNFESAFMLQSEGEADNLKYGVIYICFQESDLFILVPNPGLKFLMANEINPPFERWTTWG